MEQLLRIKEYYNFFTNEEGVAGVKIFGRYGALVNCVETELPEYSKIFAMPVFDGDDMIWFVPQYQTTPLRWKEFSSPKKEQILEQTKTDFNQTILHLTGEGKNYEAELIAKAVKHINQDFIYFIDGKIVFGVWGMELRDEFIQEPTGKVVFEIFRPVAPQAPNPDPIPEKDPTPTLPPPPKEKHTVSFYSNSNGQILGNNRISVDHGQTVSTNDIPEFVANQGYEFGGWDQNPQITPIVNPTSFTATFKPKEYHIQFTSNFPSFLSQPTSLKVPYGTSLNQNHVPVIQAQSGYRFLGWDVNPINHLVESDQIFHAKFEKERYRISFNGSEFGSFDGDYSQDYSHGDTLLEENIPTPVAKEGYTFKGWNVDPQNHRVTQDKEFVAQYERIPWYKRFWNWLNAFFIEKGCLRWILWLLLFAILIWLISYLIKSCDDRIENSEYPETVIDTVPTGDGIYGSDPYSPVPGHPENPVLPPNQQELPPIDTSQIIREPGRPVIIGNRLNILMNNADQTISQLATDFKKKYPGEQYKVVYFDDVTKRMQIEVPSNERESIKLQIPNQFKPQYDLFVFDEALFEGNTFPNDPYFTSRDCQNYLKQIQIPDAWKITTGKKEVVVAVVDNGFNLSHPEFSGQGKIVKPYNVLNHSRNVSPLIDDDHGTHVAGIAIGNKNNRSGLCGIAPDCSFMPVQVAYSNGLMTTTSILDGILYSIYQGAKVINVSLGMEFPSGIPEAQQKEIEKNHFKEEERLWNEIMRIANIKKATLVIAAGNENLIASIDPLKRNKNFIVVSSVDRYNKKSSFSNYGTFSTVSAPGENIISSYGNGYQMASGTSMAAPMVAGAVALIKSLNPNLKTEEIICVLQSTGKSTGNKIGNLVQVYSALEKVRKNDLGGCLSNQENRTPSSGDVQVLARWKNTNDLDISVIDPSQFKIWFKNKKSPTGGQLEIDMNVLPNGSTRPIENIFWPTGRAPKGTYQVFVNLYQQHNPSIIDNPYEIYIKYGDKEKHLEGSIKKSEGPKKVFQFTLN